MTAKLKTCPDSEMLTEFLLGKLPDAQLESYEYHLSTCPPCTETIRSLNVQDTFNDLAKEGFEPIGDWEIGDWENDGLGIDDSNDPDDQAAVAKLAERMKELGGQAFLDSQHHFRTDDSNATQARAAEVSRLLQPPDSENEIGRLAHYRIERLLGAGSTGVVYLATDENLNRLVALKILRPSLGSSARDRFVTEAQATAAIEAPNVVSIYHVGTEGELAYIAMQWTPGETLEQRLKREGLLPVDQVRMIGQQISFGLSVAHKKGLIHRDIKPANIWLETESNTVKILDFGLVRATDEDPQLTCTGMIAGTPCFMSPEQSRGAELNCQSDFFSLGCVLYESLTGRLPFRSANVLATLQSIQRDVPVPPSEINPAIPRDICTLTMCLLEKSPTKRPPTADSISDAIVSDVSDWSFKPAFTLNKKTKADRGSGIGSGQRKRTGWFGWAGGIIGCAALAFTALMYPQIIRIATNQGELVIETNDKDIKIEIIDDGGKIRILDLQTDQAIDIIAGKYEIRPHSDANSIEIDKHTIVMKRGSKEIVRVSRNPKRPATNKETDLEGPVHDAGTNLANAKSIISKWLERRELLRMYAPSHPKIAECDKLLKLLGHDVSTDTIPNALINNKQLCTKLLANKWAEIEEFSSKFGPGHETTRTREKLISEIALAAWKNENELQIQGSIPLTPFLASIQPKMKERAALAALFSSSHPLLKKVDDEIRRLGFDPEKSDVDIFISLEKPPTENFKSLKIEVAKLNVFEPSLQTQVSSLREQVWGNDPFLHGVMNYAEIASIKKRWYAIAIEDLSEDALNEELAWVSDFNSRLALRIQAAEQRLKRLKDLKIEFEHFERLEDYIAASEPAKNAKKRLKDLGYRFGEKNPKSSSIRMSDVIERPTDEDYNRSTLASFQLAYVDTESKLKAARADDRSNQIPKLESQLKEIELKIREIELRKKQKEVSKELERLDLGNKKPSQDAYVDPASANENQFQNGTNSNYSAEPKPPQTSKEATYRLNGTCVESDNRPVQGVEVCLYKVLNDGADRKLVAKKTTGMDGQFAFEKLIHFAQDSADSYVAICRLDGYISQRASGIGWTQNKTGAKELSFEFKIQKASKVSGNVVDHNDRPVAGMKVYQLLVGGEPVEGFAYTKTDTNGDFVLNDIGELKPTKFKNGSVMLPQAFYLRSLDHGAYRVQVKKKQSEFNFKLRKPIVVTGKVVNLANAESVAGIRLVLGSARRGRWETKEGEILQPMAPPTVTDSTGRFRFVVPEGSKLNICPWWNTMGKNAARNLVAAAVELNAKPSDQSRLRLADINLVEPIEIAGTVIDEDTNLPLNSGTVGSQGPHARSSTGEGSIKILRDGSFKALVHPGEYSFHSSTGGKGWHHTTTKVRVKRNGNLE